MSEIIERAILTPKRTEYGKAIRKAYESGEVKESRHNMTELEPRTDGISNTITTVQKDNLLLECRKEILGSIYTEASDDFQRGIYPIARTVKAEKHDLGVVEMEVNKIGNIYGFDGGNYAGNVYDTEQLAPTLRSHSGGNTEPMIVAMRGRNPDNPSDRSAGSPTEQRLEPNCQGICNTLTSVQKDNLVMETVRIKQATKDGYIDCNIGSVADLSYPDSETRRGRVQENGEVCPTITASETGICRIESIYRIRKLTPLECWRLMGFSDEYFTKAEQVNTNTQLYKQAGNSIVKDVLMAILGQMMPRKENVYRERN